jgi:hypothetical protein
MIHYYFALPPLEGSDSVKENKDMQRLVFGVLGAIIIIGASTIIIAPIISNSIFETDLISISDVTIIESSYKCEAYFTLTNSGDEDSFVDIEMFVYLVAEYREGQLSKLSNRHYAVQEQFFIKANTIEERYMQSERVPKYHCKYPVTNIEVIKN